MKELLTFDDVLIVPKFSSIKSRSEVDLSDCAIRYAKWTLPIISSNMDTITEVKMAKAMADYGGLACLHRFWSIEDNVAAFLEATSAWVSVGLGDKEWARAKALHAVGSRVMVLDVAHASQTQVAERYVDLKCLNDTFVIVGNFATGESVQSFKDYLKLDLGFPEGLDGVKVGIGPGAACTTRIKTGCGYPQLSAIQSVRESYKGLLIADGGVRSPGDVCKALAGGADLIMLGSILAGTEETPGEVEEYLGPGEFITEPTKYKKYRGSASQESYDVQGKNSSFRTAEGESFMVSYKGPVSKILQDIEGGIRSAFAYVGAKDIKEFQEKAELVRVSSSTISENSAHGKRS